MKYVRFVLLLFLLSSSSALGDWKGVTLSETIPFHEANTHRHFEDLIRQAYSDVELYALTATPVEFRLSNFRTETLEEVSSERYPTLATLPGGSILQVTRDTETYPDGSSTLAYLYKWVDKSPLSEVPESSLLLTGTIGQILKRAGEDSPEILEAKFVTRFEVRVQAAGRNRSYTAAALWIPASEKNHWYFLPFDHITGGLATVGRETVPPRSEVNTLDRNPGGEEVSLGTRTGVADRSLSCGFIRVLTPVDANATGQNFHVGGQHSMSWDGKIDCSCSTTCASQCSFQRGTADCLDSGVVTTSCHRPAHDQKSTSGYKGDGRTAGAKCSAGYGCAVTSCFGCACGFSVEVAFGESGGVTLGASKSPLWSETAGGNYECAPCSETQACLAMDGVLGCESEETEPNDPHQDIPSPIVISLTDQRFAFTDVAGGVRFDIDADGFVEQVSWTEMGSDDYFLTLDRDASGTIDSGRELFGNYTTQETRPDGLTDGFRALRWFDHPARGGNDDGWISSADLVFTDLRLWRDGDQDGGSQPEELHGLSDLGVIAIELDPVISEKRDRHGNVLRWRSQVLFADRGTKMAAADVIFRTE